MGENKKTKEDVEYPEISKELSDMMDEDQKVARRLNMDNKGDESWKEFNKLNEKHRNRLKEIIKDIGWPTIPKVGKRACDSAWLVAQHSDEDVEFQKECLKLIKKNKNNVFGSQIGYLTDRILINEDKPQIYGTQLDRDEKGNLEPKNIEDKEKADKLRKELGMMTLDEYLDYVEKSVKKKV